MADARRTLPNVLFAAACIVLIALTFRFLRAGSHLAAVGALPSPEHLDSLSRYLQPVQVGTGLDDYGAFIPADDPPQARTDQPAPEPPRTVPDWQVSAIIIAGDRPIAIIDDQTVGPGSTLPDGSVVESIEREHVIVREPSGERHRLSITTG